MTAVVTVLSATAWSRSARIVVCADSREAIYELGLSGRPQGRPRDSLRWTPSRARLACRDSDGKATRSYAVCQPKPGVNAHYYAFIVREHGAITVDSVRSLGACVNVERFLDTTLSARQHVPLPPPDEQAAIVRFLDWANGRLERAIRAKRKVIALLNEQKQAIIHRAVTRGLDPSVPLKPSGIPWLGDIPQHWEVRRLKYLRR